MNKNFLIAMVGFQIKFPNETFAIAVSGGADSMALLHFVKNSGAKCVALTVDHGLRPESAAEAKHVAKICKELEIPHTILKWTGEKPTAGVEEKAREARYNLMLDYCKKNNIGVLMTAHQADDQIETFLINLGRGSGVYGLSGIREQTIRDGIIIFRPLLGIYRTELEKFCQENKIQYFNDSMNDDENYLRVKIRKNHSLLGTKLGITDDRLLLAIDNLGRARDFIESESNRILSSISVSEFDSGILLNHSDEIRFRVLSIILGDNYPIRMNSIKLAFQKLDSGDCKFTLGNYNIRRRGNKIRIWKEGTKWSKH
jgi:tRNA(Ile)-lysidine synthase